MKKILLVALCAGATLILPPQRADAAPVTKRLAVVVIQNGDTDRERLQLADGAYLQGLFFGGGGSLSGWTRTVSHGLLNYVPAGDGVFLARPSTELTNADKTRCQSEVARRNAEQHLSAIGVAWDSLAVVFDIGACSWGGLGQMPGRVTWYPPRPSLSAIVHEAGHNHGYPHQEKRDCADGRITACKTNGYSGNTPMGSGGSGKGYSSVELLHSGWLEPGWLKRTGAAGTFSLKPLHAPVSETGVRVVEFTTSSTISYVIETRAPSLSGMDLSVSNPGVRVYSVTSKDYKRALMINPGGGYVQQGAVITDSANKITITVRSSSAAGATVHIAPVSAARPATSAPVRTTSAQAAPAATTEPGPSSDPSPGMGGDESEPDFGADIVAEAAPMKRSQSWIYATIGVVVGLAAISGALLWLIQPKRGRHAR